IHSAGQAATSRACFCKTIQRKKQKQPHRRVAVDSVTPYQNFMDSIPADDGMVTSIQLPLAAFC
ncbi:MAG: hypothetical protein ACP5FH_10455, partial [Terracidiphilus sp.]